MEGEDIDTRFQQRPKFTLKENPREIHKVSAADPFVILSLVLGIPQTPRINYQGE